MKTRSARQRQRGMGLVDMGLTIAITGMGLVLVGTLYTNASSDMRAMSAAAEIAEMQGRVRDYFAPRDGYDAPALSTALAQNLNLVPAKMLKGSPPTPRSAWGTAVSIDAVDARTFRIQLQVPREACASFVSRMADQVLSASVDAGGGPVAVATNGALDVSTLTSECDRGAMLGVVLDSA